MRKDEVREGVRVERIENPGFAPGQRPKHVGKIISTEAEKTAGAWTAMVLWDGRGRPESVIISRLRVTSDAKG